MNGLIDVINRFINLNRPIESIMQKILNPGMKKFNVLFFKLKKLKIIYIFGF
jgi:hypothetical protein